MKFWQRLKAGYKALYISSMTRPFMFRSGKPKFLLDTNDPAFTE